MKAKDLADEFARILTADVAFAGSSCRSAQDKATQTFPAIIIECDVMPLDSAARCLSYEARFDAQTHAADDEGATPSDEAQAERVSLIHRKFFGVTAGDLTTAKAAITAAMLAGGKFTLHNYDAGTPGDATTEDSRFRTKFVIRGIAKVTGSI